MAVFCLAPLGEGEGLRWNRCQSFTGFCWFFFPCHSPAHPPKGTLEVLQESHGGEFLSLWIGPLTFMGEAEAGLGNSGGSPHLCPVLCRPCLLLPPPICHQLRRQLPRSPSPERAAPVSAHMVPALPLLVVRVVWGGGDCPLSISVPLGFPVYLLGASHPAGPGTGRCNPSHFLLCFKRENIHGSPLCSSLPEGQTSLPVNLPGLAQTWSLGTVSRHEKLLSEAVSV